jgi:predicted Zn-dependent peptidase
MRAGARFDGSKPGLAHLTEHMLFQGTASLDQIALNRRAAELGGEHNADTGYEDISLTFEVFNEDLGAALGLMADQFYNTQVDEKRLRKERRVVMEEVRARQDDPQDQAYQRAWRRFFDGPLAHPVYGSLASVRQIQVRDVAAFLQRYFAHENSVLAVVGGVSARAVREAVRKHFNHSGSGVPARPPGVRFHPGGRFQLRTGNGNQVHLNKMMAVSPEPRHLLATGVALDIVGADPDSRLFQELRERLGLSYEVSATLDWGPDWAVAILSASAARPQAARLMRAIDETCERAASDGFAEEEFHRARKKSRYRYALLGDNRLEEALAMAESALLGFPTPREAETIVEALSLAEVEDEWRGLLSARSVTALIS